MSKTLPAQSGKSSETGIISTRVFRLLVPGVTSLLAIMAIKDVLSQAERLGIDALASKTWLVLFGSLIIFGGLSLLSLAITVFTQHGLTESLQLSLIHNIFVRLKTASKKIRWLGWLILIMGLAIYPLCVVHPYYGGLLYKQPWLRGFIFWMMSLVCAGGFAWAAGRGYNAGILLVTVLFQSTLTRLLLYLPDISSYPFAMGWSETSRFYYPALFLSQKIFGQGFAWPILHPSLHLLLIPPYLIDAPLWLHRAWQVILRAALLGLIAPTLLSRLKIETRITRWLTGIWILVYLLTLPLYMHLAVPVLIMVWGYSSTEKNQSRIWVWLSLASIWAGLSRLNWYPVPAMLAAALYALETPVGKKGWRYLLQPAAWFIYGTSLAFLTMQIYIRFSGINNQADFYTSLNSNLLWNRMLPNASYWLGVLPAILIFSLPLWMGIIAKAKELGLHTLRIGLLLAMLAALFAGGLLVSMKIGGGADIHNMDAYAVLLLVVFVYAFCGKISPEAGVAAQSMQPSNKRPMFSHAGITVLLVLVPAWFAVLDTSRFLQFDAAQTQIMLSTMQKKVNEVNAQDGDILFITQRHLISMHMLNNVTLIPEYEREELMEMAMAENDAYLKIFRADLEAHRFAAIIVDPLRFNIIEEQEAVMGAENNAWARFVIRPILCNYEQDVTFPDDRRVAIYIPRTGDQKCP